MPESDTLERPAAPPPRGLRLGPVGRAVVVVALVCVPLLAPMTSGGDAGDGSDGVVAGPVTPVVPLAAAARVVRVDQPAPAARPVGLSIPAIGVREDSLLDLTLDSSGKLAAPDDFNAVGWFAAGPAPGDVGAAVLVGHVDSYRGPAVFFRVRDLKPGDGIDVPRADGSTVRFVVDAVEQYSKAAFPADKVYAPTADPQLRLITCGGSFDRSVRSYRDNIVVYASLR